MQRSFSPHSCRAALDRYRTLCGISDKRLETLRRTVSDAELMWRLENLPFETATEEFVVAIERVVERTSSDEPLLRSVISHVRRSKLEHTEARERACDCLRGLFETLCCRAMLSFRGGEPGRTDSAGNILDEWLDGAMQLESAGKGRLLSDTLAAWTQVDEPVEARWNLIDFLLRVRLQPGDQDMFRSPVVLAVAFDEELWERQAAFLSDPTQPQAPPLFEEGLSALVYGGVHMLLGLQRWGADFPSAVPSLIASLPALYGVDPAELDYSLSSMRAINGAIDRIGVDRCLKADMFMPLVAYAGEVLLRSNNARWEMRLSSCSTVWEPWIVSDKGECDPYHNLYKTLLEHSTGEQYVDGTVRVYSMWLQGRGILRGIWDSPLGE